jgi:hypothetical protein
MAITQSNYLGNGSTTSFAFTFNYLSTADVKVSINGTLTTAWVFTGPQTILFGTAPASGAVIRIFRDTQIEVLEATISSGGAIKASDLNDNFTQSLHALQEIENNGGGSGVPGPGITDGNKADITVSNGGATWTINNGSVSGAKIDGTVPMTSLLNMGTYRVTNLASPTVGTDAATKAYADSLAASALSDGDKGDITVSDNGDTWTIDNGAVTAAKIATDTITGTQIAANAVGASELADDAVDTGAIANLAVTTAKLADLSVTAGKIAADTITAAQIAPNAVGASELADDAVDTAAIANLAVTTAKLADLSVTAGKIANDTITSAQIATDAVGAAELADNAVDTAAIANLAVTTAKLADLSVAAGKIANDAVGTAAIANLAVTTAKLADLSVTAGKIANDTITATQIAPNAVGASELADDAVDTAAIVNLAVTTAKLADLSVTAGKIAADTITAAQIAPNAVGASELADDSVDTAAIVNGAVTGVKIANATITATQIAADTITTAQIAPDAVGASELANNAVDTAAIANLAVTTDKLADFAVTAAKIANDTITSTQIGPGAVGASELATNSVDTANIINSAVTEAKIANDAVTASKIAANAVGASELADDAVDTAAIANLAVTTNKLADLSVTAGKIAADTITAAQIAPNAVGASELADNSVDTAAIVAGAVTGPKIDGTVAMTGLLNMGNFKVTNLASPTVSSDAATRGFVESFFGIGVPDGDKGDIIVSGSGSLWTIDAGVVTAAKTTATPNNTANELVSRSASGNIDISSINGSPIGGQRNKILNGNFLINQREGLNLGVATTNGQFGPDRWNLQIISSGAVSLFRAVDATTNQSLVLSYGAIAVSTIDSAISSSEYALFEQAIEGINTNGVGFAWGTAFARPVTLSFLARSNITGTFCVAIRNNNFTRSYIAQYTINTANTYEQKIITIPGDTVGDWNDSALAGIRVAFTVACGSTFHGTNNSWNAGNFLASANQTNLLNGANELRITNVQLEAGSIATPFERLGWAETLQLVKRYYQTSFTAGGSTGKQSTLISPVVMRRLQAESQTLWFDRFEVEMRVSPTMTWYSPGVGTAGAIRNTSLGTNITVTGNSNVTAISGKLIQGVTHASEGSLGHIILGHYTADAEI